MIALIGTILVASLLGSMHCVGMCGAFVAFACTSAPDDRAPRRSWLPPHASLIIAYNGGRLLTYTLLGALAGLLGQAIDLGASAIGLQRAAAGLAAAFLIGFGVISILRIKGVRVPKMPIPTPLQRVVAAGHRRAMDMSPIMRALVVGLLTTLLPCGWLYAFAVAAAGTGNPLLGAVTMAAFWMGTLPALVALGASLQHLGGSLAARMPLLTSLAIVVVGLLTLAGRLPMLMESEAMAGDARRGRDDRSCGPVVLRAQMMTAREGEQRAHATWGTGNMIGALQKLRSSALRCGARPKARTVFAGPSLRAGPVHERWALHVSERSAHGRLVPVRTI